MKKMSKPTTPPARDPDLGVWTSIYVLWAIENENDEYFLKTFGCSKDKAAETAGLNYKAPESTADEKPPAPAKRAAKKAAKRKEAK